MTTHTQCTATHDGPCRPFKGFHRCDRFIKEGQHVPPYSQVPKEEHICLCGFRWRDQAKRSNR